MPTQETSKTGEGRERSLQEKSRDVVRGVEFRFIPGSLDAGKFSVDQAVREPGVEDAQKDLTARLSEITMAELTLKDLIRSDGYKSLSPQEKVAFHKALETAKFYTMHAFAEPADIEAIQKRWEDAVENMRRNEIEPRFRARDAFSGQTTKFDEKSLRSDEALELREYVEKAKILQPVDRTEIVAALQKAANELVRAEGSMESLAATKRFPLADRDRRIETYNAAAATYQKKREDVRGLLDRLKGYAPN